MVWGEGKEVLISQNHRIWETKAPSDQHLACRNENSISLGGTLCPAAGTTGFQSASLLCFPFCSWSKFLESVGMLRKVCSGPCC